MKKMYTIIFFLCFNSAFSQEDVAIELLSATFTKSKSITLIVKITNTSDTRYILPQDYTLSDHAPDFSLGTYNRVIITDDTAQIFYPPVKLNIKKKKEKKKSVILIGEKSETTINLNISDLLSQEEGMAYAFKFMQPTNLYVSLKFYNSGSISVKDKRIMRQIKRKKYVAYNGTINTNKILIEQ